MSQKYACSFPGFPQTEGCDWHVEGMLCLVAGRIWIVAFLELAFLLCVWGEKGEQGCCFNTSGQKIKLVAIG